MSVLFGIASLSGIAVAHSLANGPAPTSSVPIQAELIGPLDISRLKEGAPVLARVSEDWKREDCHLLPGSLVHGHIVGLTRRSKVEKVSSIQVRFEKAQCQKGESGEYPLTLIGLIGPFGEAPGGSSGLSEAPPLADVPGLSIGVNRAPPGEAGAYMRSVESASAANEYSQVVRRTRKLPPQILPGQVIDVPKTDLHVGTGVDGASIVSATRADVRLEPRTLLLLWPSALLNPTQHGSAEASGRKASLLPPAARELSASTASPAALDQTEVCSGACDFLGSLDTRTATISRSASTLPLTALGYAPHDKQRSLSFNRETTLTYLDEHHLLCTFDPHVLRSRSLDGTEPIRRVRAALIDPGTRTVRRVLDWRVRGNDGYLWRYGNGMVLVHMEHELRLFNADLAVQRSIPVDGPVPWVVSSPSNDHTAVAVIKRRYSLDEFREIEQSGEKPDEDLEVRVYDRDWNLVSTSLRSSGTAIPVLSDAGELRVNRLAAGRWKIAEYDWNKTAHELATVHSVCRPLVSALEHELTFVTGCMATSGDVWYRMLRPDGRPLLKAESASDEIVQSAEGSRFGSFAIRVIKAVRPIAVDQPFSRADLLKEEIGIYRSSDGARIGSVVTDDFILAQNSYALSPQGGEIAVAGNQNISFYPLSTRP